MRLKTKLDKTSVCSFWEIPVVGQANEVWAREVKNEPLLSGTVVNSKLASLGISCLGECRNPCGALGYIYSECTGPNEAQRATYQGIHEMSYHIIRVWYISDWFIHDRQE